MKYILPIYGREVELTDEELIGVIKDRLMWVPERGQVMGKKSEESLEKVPENGLKAVLENGPKAVPEGPKEGIPFYVNPEVLNQELFDEPREDPEQEDVRRAIVEAFDEVAKNPEHYSKPFKTLIIERTWLKIRPAEFSVIAKDVMEENASRIADWVEQALEWAQRIQNGETWERLCNQPDGCNWFRAVIGREGVTYCVGGSKKSYKKIHSQLSATQVYAMGNLETEYAVPLVVIK